MKLNNLEGLRFGRLLAQAPINAESRGVWKCLCDCGQCVQVQAHRLKSGHTKSCGCLHKGPTARGAKRHGMTDTPTYRSWAAMVTRCMNPKSQGFPTYGGRGISVCQRWRKFDSFLEDMGERPEGKTLDRLDGSKGYEPGNCRWATPREQSLNRTSTRLFNLNGCVASALEWAEVFGINYDTFLSRVRAGWGTYAALSTPPLKGAQR